MRMVATTTIGLVSCGGASTRMGTDKSLLVYHEKPQRYHVYELLQFFCKEVYLSCNAAQLPGISGSYQTMPDLPAYEHTGPMAALLTAYQLHPGHHFLVLGCDYPFITTATIAQLLPSAGEEPAARALYREREQVYEPLLAFYPATVAGLLQQLWEQRQYSLQRLLKTVHAKKIIPAEERVMQSIDTPEAFAAAKAQLMAARGGPENKTTQ